MAAPRWLADVIRSTEWFSTVNDTDDHRLTAKTGPGSSENQTEYLLILAGRFSILDHDANRHSTTMLPDVGSLTVATAVAPCAELGMSVQSQRVTTCGPLMAYSGLKHTSVVARRRLLAL
jgi:hypothetical protein